MEKLTLEIVPKILQKIKDDCNTEINEQITDITAFVSLLDQYVLKDKSVEKKKEIKRLIVIILAGLFGFISSGITIYNAIIANLN